GVHGPTGLDAPQIVGDEAVDELERARAGEAQLSHVGDVEEPGAVSDRLVLGDDAFVLNRHEPAGKGHQTGAQGLVSVEEGGLAELRCRNGFVSHDLGLLCPRDADKQVCRAPPAMLACQPARNMPSPPVPKPPRASRPGHPPASKPRAAPGPVAAPTDVTVRGVGSLPGAAHGASPLGDRAEDGAARKERGEVLIVVADDWMAALLRGHLSHAGFHVQVAGEAREAYRLARTALPECIVCDDELPDIDGFWLIDRVRRDPGPVSAVPILLLTANVDEVRGADVGADLLLRKPLDNEEVVAQVAALLELARRLKGRR